MLGPRSASVIANGSHGLISRLGRTPVLGGWCRVDAFAKIQDRRMSIQSLSSMTVEKEKESKSHDQFLLRSLPFKGSTTLSACTTAHLQMRCVATAATSKDGGDSETKKKSMRERAGEMQANARTAASEMRDSARGHYKDFRSDPGKSAVQGAKSFGGMLRQYGPVFIGTYFTIYVATLGTLFSGVQSGLLDPVALFGMLGHLDESGQSASTVQLVVDFMQSHDFTKPYAGIVEKNPAVANFAVAWIAVKFTEPIRLPLALGATPRVARYLGWNVPKVEDAVDSSGEKDEKTL